MVRPAMPWRDGTLLVVIVLCLGPWAWAGPYECSFPQPPRRVLSGESIRIRVRYRAPDQPPVRLNCEVKGARDYHVTAQRMVSGTGEVVFQLQGPSLRQSRDVQLITWIGNDWRKPLNGELVRASAADVITPARADRLERQRQEAERRLKSRPDRAAAVGVYAGHNSAWANVFRNELIKDLRSLGMAAEGLGDGDLTNPYLLTRDSVTVVVLLDPQAVPMGAADALESYVRRGGRLLVAGGPAFTEMLYPFDGRWLAAGAYRDACVEGLAPTPILTFDEGRIGRWTRSSNDPDARSVAELARPGVDRTPGCLHVAIKQLSGWDTFAHRLDPASVANADEDAWLTFAARGGPRTSQLAVELREGDGSRWIATIALSRQWQRVALPPEAFSYWHDSGSENRGGVGDRVSMAHAESMSFGLALTHTSAVGGGDHLIWVDAVGWASDPEQEIYTEAFFDPAEQAPRIETVSPDYKVFPVTTCVSLRPHAHQALVPPLRRDVQAGMSPVPRPQGTGFGKNRRWRFIPLLEYVDQDGRFCGTAASLCLMDAREGAGMAATVGMTDAASYDDETARWMAQLARRLHSGLFLYEGGAAYYASFGNETMPVGAVVTNRSERQRETTVTIDISAGDGRRVWHERFAVRVPAGDEAAVSANWQVPAAGDNAYTVEVLLADDDAVVDRLRHQVQIWRPPDEPHFLSREGGQFILDGTTWYAHGVNYMPSSGIGIEDTAYFEYWLDPQPYDPEVIERDLDDIERIGFNLVSVFQYRRSMESRNLLDLIMRCRRHGLKVNLSLRPGTPMAFRWDDVREMILAARLPENDTVIAYDLAWEPLWRGHEQRRPYDELWENWVEETYGSVAQAEKVWGCPIPRENGNVTNPADRQTSEEGPWRAMVNDYYRFLNQLLNERYGRARALVRTADPRHLVSFRMSMAGDPTRNNRSLTYDFVGLKDAVDILEPEAYGRIGDWERVKPGWFTVAYARAVAPDLPVLWAEFGTSVWNRSDRAVSSSALDSAAQFYRDFYSMAHRSGANGTVCWWFPGGYRWNERSDFGILNPDRSWRPVTHVINAWRDRMTAPRPLPQSDVVIPFDRSATCRQVPGIYDQVNGRFWQAVADGKHPSLRESAKP